MKKIIAILVLLCLFSGCGTPSEGPETTAPTVPQATPAPTEAPTEPPTQPPAAAPEPEEDVLVRVLDYLPTVRQALAYATEYNFTGQRIYDFTDAYLRYGTLKKLIPVCEALAGEGLGLLIWDGFRPVSAQRKLWEVCPDPAFVSHPETGSRAHCRGSALDITLFDLETGEALPMPTRFDDFSDLADRDYSDCDPEAAANARYLQQLMEENGFTPYFGEWWHFSDPDHYEVEEGFQPPQTIFEDSVG